MGGACSAGRSLALEESKKSFVAFAVLDGDLGRSLFETVCWRQASVEGRKVEVK